MAVVSINGFDYVLKRGTKLTWSYVQPFQDVIRQREGYLSPQDNQAVTRLKYGWKNGIGWVGQEGERGRGECGLGDSTWNTLHRQASYGILHESQTHAAPADHLVAYVNFKSDLWGLFEEDYANNVINNV